MTVDVDNFHAIADHISPRHTAGGQRILRCAELIDAQEEGIRVFGNRLLRLSVSDGHEGEVSYEEILKLASFMGVELKL